MNDPITVGFITIVTCYVARLWVMDFLRKGTNAQKEFPGTGNCSLLWILIGAQAGLFLLATETLGEKLLGVSDQQSTLKAYAILAILSAAFYEELVFRGYFVVEKYGRRPMVFFAVLLSALFALLHPFLWNVNVPEGVSFYAIHKLEWTFDFSVKAWFSTGMKFIFSIVFYWLRLNKRNKEQSLLPCFVGHATFNVGVFFIKLFQGYVTF